MALDQSALLELVEQMRSAEPNEFMRRMLGVILQELVDAEATAHIGAELHERSEDRTTQRNGTRDKLVTTTAGDLTVKIPKVRTGSFFPALLNPRRRIDVALHAVVMQAARASRRVGSMTWSSHSAAPASARARSAGSAASSTPRSLPGGPGHSMSRPSPTSISTRPTARCGSTSALCPRPS
ncbi:MAG: transposase [Frankiales bacterium]|nr:transposase [Frankiales bacterium]